MSYLSFIERVMQELHPLWISEYFRIPAFLFVFIVAVSFVKWMIGGASFVRFD